MKYLLIKDHSRRILFSFYERRHNFLISQVNNLKLTHTLRVQAYSMLLSLSRDSSVTRIRNRCTLTGRPRAVYSLFGISRLMFRKLA